MYIGGLENLPEGEVKDISLKFCRGVPGFTSGVEQDSGLCVLELYYS